MSFDKVKAMRNAERYLSQGKIRAAVGEYKQVVESDPRDFSTMNILGDLCAKNSETNEAVRYYTKVAEHYGNQGFAQKAIAIYNKIARFKPGSIEISAKLAELHRIKGSVAEARVHYTTVAEEYQRRGKKLEALDAWRSIAELDPNNTDIYLRIADVYKQENHNEDAAKSYTEAGLRLANLEQHEQALSAFSKAFELIPNDINLLNGMVKSQIATGYSDEAAKTLETLIGEQPDDKDLKYLLIDCYLDLERPLDAERIIHQLVEREPAEYPKLLELLDIYFKLNDTESATRILLITSEQLLVSGKSDELRIWLNETLVRNPENIEALRLLVRFYSWQRDETELRSALERLAESARLNDSIDDERYALTQLVVMLPNESDFAQRLQEINSEHGFVEVASIVSLKQEPEESLINEVGFENFAIVSDQAQMIAPITSFEKFENLYAGENDSTEISTNGSLFDESIEAEKNSTFQTNNKQTELETESSVSEKSLSLSEERKIQQELESVEFYVAQGYKDLAVKSLDSLESEFGNRDEFNRYRKQLNGNGSSPQTETVSEIYQSDSLAEIQVEDFDPMGDFRDALGLEESEISSMDDDYETHYQLAIAYKEMGLLEDAIKEFQDAINMALPDDGTSRFFQCANLLGFCFMEKQMPNLALMWYRRALETVTLSNEEKHALQYEIACAYQAGGDEETARKYFEQVYVVDVDYRDVSDRLQKLQDKVLQ
ncbi:MAG: tetratricopeptide repeat protein [Pyrinomonadaceae bacterium]